jgi:hypothetical protein
MQASPMTAYITIRHPSAYGLTPRRLLKSLAYERRYIHGVKRRQDNVAGPPLPHRQACSDNQRFGSGHRKQFERLIQIKSIRLTEADHASGEPDLTPRRVRVPRQRQTSEELRDKAKECR